MKSTNIESTTVKAIALLNVALTTLARINNNNDAETLRRECIAFRNTLDITPCKLGNYTMPKGYQDFIDSQTTGATSDIRSRRQATTNSIIACFALDKKGSRTAAYLKEALKGKTALEAISPLEWAVLKTKVNLAEKKAKEARDTIKAKEAQAKLDALTPAAAAAAAPAAPAAAPAPAPAAPAAPAPAPAAPAPAAPAPAANKISFKARFTPEIMAEAKTAIITVVDTYGIPTAVAIARMILAQYESAE
jgi:hypothetical protein